MSFYNGKLNHDEHIHVHGQTQRGLPGVGFKLDSNNDYDMQNKKLVNVKQGTGENEVVTKSYLDSEIAKISSLDTSQFVLKAGDLMSGDLVLQRKYSYPIPGDLNKVISYENIREIFYRGRKRLKWMWIWI